ncbi:MAG TPA: sensor histidine kinase [Ideonella sp.]|nr:sensor histidine kinase [Ideonella sp.]
MMDSRLKTRGPVAGSRTPPARPGAETAQAGLRGEPLPAAGTPIAGPAAELLQELDTPLGAALAAASLQAERLRDLAEHLGVSADARASALLAELDESGRLLGDSVQHAVRLLRRQQAHAAPAPTADAAAGLAEAQPLAVVLACALRLPLARCGEQAIDCSLEVESGLAAPGSPGAWSQVLAQLVANSVLHGFEGRPGGRIRITAQRHGPHVLRVTYQDDGVGLSPAAREQVFRRRFTSRAAQGSSGLGLCILRDIVQAQLNGAIALLETAAGAAFVIDVPAQRTA